MSGAIGLAGFSAKFAADPDPWSTLSDPDEVLKRRAVLHAVGAGPVGRVLEVAAGNGSNSVALAGIALRLDATEGTATGTALVRAALAKRPRARAAVLELPGRAPRPAYDVVVVAELLYYLEPAAMAAVARSVRGWLAPGGRLVLAHHRIDFYDFAQRAEGIHERFLAETRCRWERRIVRRTRRWIVCAATRLGNGAGRADGMSDRR